MNTFNRRKTTSNMDIDHMPYKKVHTFVCTFTSYTYTSSLDIHHDADADL